MAAAQPYAGKDPDEDEIARLTAQAAGYDSILLLTCNGHLFPGQIALARGTACPGASP